MESLACFSLGLLCTSVPLCLCGECLSYVELHARSAFSFLEGASLPEDLAAVCAQLSLPAMALLDANGVYGAPRFHLAAKKAKIKAHIGAEVSANIFSPRKSQRHREK